MAVVYCKTDREKILRVDSGIAVSRIRIADGRITLSSIECVVKKKQGTGSGKENNERRLIVLTAYRRSRRI